MFVVLVGPLRVVDILGVVYIAVPVRPIEKAKPVISSPSFVAILLSSDPHSKYHASSALGFRSACRPLVNLYEYGTLHIRMYHYLE